MKALLRFIGWPLVAGVLLALFIVDRFPEWVGKHRPYTLQQGEVPSSSLQGPYSYSQAVQRAAPAVVNLYTKRFTAQASPLETEPQLKHFFDQNTDAPRKKRMQSSLGSAVIMSPEGYLLTNNHVTANADEIVVALRDGRETMGRIIGSDPDTDLAVVKIDLDQLPAITLGHSEHVQVGDVTLAIGNPLGVGQTVTMGIISATGRNQLGLNTYEDFIQTDAAINVGNSGGALVDANGHLIGINTAILSESGGSQGIGFAIPTKLALEVMESIIQYGQVVRGWLGVEVQILSTELAKAYQLEGRNGIVITGIYEGGPLDKAGLQEGDLILSIDGQAALNGRQLMNLVARKRPGESVTIEVLRIDTPIKTSAHVTLRPVSPEPANNAVACPD